MVRTLVADFAKSAGLPKTLPFVRKNRDDKVVKLGGSWFRVYPFETRRCGEARSCPPRSVGATCMAQDYSQDLTAIGQHEALAVCRGFLQEPDPTQSAKEKVVFGNRRGEILVFQGDRLNGSAALCSCGNATAAGAAMLAHSVNHGLVCQVCSIPEGQLEMCSWVTPAGGGWRVAQSWCGLSFPVVQASLLGHKVAIGTGTFNNYVILSLPGRAPESFAVPEVLALWEAARPFGFDNILRARLAAIFPADPHPFVTFYTCGRMHPGAPLTGLAALAMAARQVAWLASLLKLGRIQHRRGFDSLPVCRDSEVDFPAIHVVLKDQRRQCLAA